MSGPRPNPAGDAPVPTGVPWRMHVVITAAALVTVSAVAFGFHKGLRMTAGHAPLVDATMEIKLAATTAHLWFEEIVTGDRHEEMDTVWQQLDLADWYARAMLSGGESAEGVFLPLEDAAMRQDIQSVQRGLADFRRLTKKRWAAAETSGIGTEIDQEYDQAFTTLLDQTDKVETCLQRNINEDLKSFGRTQTAVIAVCLALALVVGSTFHRFDRRRAQDLRDLDQMNASLAGQIAERERAEQAVRKLNAELEQRVASRTTELTAVNNELEAFCYSVSHDLRAPLRAMSGFSQALAEDYGERLDDQARDYLTRIQNAGRNMGSLIDDLLTLSRLTRADLSCRQVDLSELSREVAAGLRQREPEREVTMNIEEGLTAFGDPRMLRILLENLLANAWKFTARRDSALIDVGTTSQNGTRAFFVRDDGAGFDMKYANKLFGAFQRLHSTAEFEGSGVGLATAQRIVHTHGGKVWAEGRVGQGATFYFTLAPHQRSQSP